MIISFTVYGKPEPAGSKKAFVVKAPEGSGRRDRAVVVDDAKHSKSWKQEVASAALAEMERRGLALLDEPVRVLMEFYFVRPRSHYRTGRFSSVLRDDAPPYRSTKPDGLKLARAVEDAMTGIVYRDDALIVDGRQVKRYVTAGVERQGVRVTVMTLD